MIIKKTPEEIGIMAEGGRRLSKVKESLEKKVKAGVSAIEIEILANKLIKKEGGEASFKMVPGYSWATCINLNSGLVHGIPKKEMVFKKGDLVSVDVGMLYKGFHTDTSVTVAIEADSEIQRFLSVGKRALNEAISKVRVGNYIYTISEAIEKILKAGGYSPIRALVGHGVGRKLHEEPQIPCFLPFDSAQGKPVRIEDSAKIEPGMVLAIEVMYAIGSPDVVQFDDGWTIATRDGKISGLFEETVAVTSEGPIVLTAAKV